jgi:hypothetical protein
MQLPLFSSNGPCGEHRCAANVTHELFGLMKRAEISSPNVPAKIKKALSHARAKAFT